MNSLIVDETEMIEKMVAIMRRTSAAVAATELKPRTGVTIKVRMPPCFIADRPRRAIKTTKIGVH